MRILSIIPAVIVIIVVIIYVTYRVLRATKSKVKPLQKREYFRVDVPEPESFVAKLELDNGSLVGCRLMNVSIGGVCVLAVHLPVVLEIGSTIKEIMILFPGGAEVRSPAVVKYIASESESGWNKYGIEFTDLSGEQRDTIARYVLQTEAKEIKQQRTTQTKGETADS